MDSAALTSAIKQHARHLGFDLAGVCPAVVPTGFHRLHEWLSAGYAGEMHYLAARAAAYEHPRHVLDNVQSLVLLAMNYRTAEPVAPRAGQGKISRYAWGQDYHDLIHARLKQLADFLRQAAPDALVRGVVDTAPLLEREFAQLAGLGWVGKNTLLLNRQMGSWFFLAALLTDLPLDYDAPHELDHCGTCTACLDACPTDAFVAPYVLDSRRCISYLTIELRENVPVGLREGIGDWVFGCDVCQDVCPWNRRAPTTSTEALQPGAGQNPLELAELFTLRDESFRQRFRNSPLWRAKRRGLLRNAAIVLGNQRASSAYHALAQGLEDQEPLVRAACAWALGHLRTTEALQNLRQRLEFETDAAVRQELTAAIQAASTHSASSATAPSGPAGA